MDQKQSVELCDKDLSRRQLYDTRVSQEECLLTESFEIIMHTAQLPSTIRRSWETMQEKRPLWVVGRDKTYPISPLPIRH